MTIISSDNEQTIDNQKEKADTPHEPLEISLIRGHIEDAYAAMQSNDYKQATHHVRMAAYHDRDIIVDDDGTISVCERTWSTWPPKD